MAEPTYGIIRSAIFRAATEEEIQQEHAHRQEEKGKNLPSESYLLDRLGDAWTTVSSLIWKGPKEYITTTEKSTDVEHSITNITIANAILKFHRDGELLNGGKGGEAVLNLIKEIFPNDTFDINDYIFYCSQDRTKFYHKLLRNRMSDEVFTEFTPLMNDCAKNMLTAWHSQKSPQDIVTLCKNYAAANFAILLFGKDVFSTELAKAIDELHKYLLKIISKTVTDADRQSFLETSGRQLKDAIEGILQMENLPLFEGEDLTPSQKKALIFVLLFAGQETSASTLCYMIWKLASTPGMQDILHNQITTDQKSKALDSFFTESMREFTPIYQIHRRIKKDACLEYKDGGQLHRRVFFQDELVAIKIDKIAEGIAYDPENKTGAWSGFGSGKHLCPGKRLAEDELKIFIKHLVQNYTVQTAQKDVEKAKLITTTFTKPIFASLQKREGSE